MGIHLDTNVINHEQSESALDSMKRMERKTKMHAQRLNAYTIVMCKNKKRIEEYRKSLNIKL